MSILYGVWRRLPCPQTIEDCSYFTQQFDGWKCDYSGANQLGPVAFGCNLFRIYPESEEEIQPLQDTRGNVLLTVDCRLDNREELANALELDSTTLRQTPDSKLILKAYLKWGKDCFKRLSGDFALALWDQPKQELILVRDLMGVRPLAYATWHDGVAFSSSIPELYHLPAVPPDLDDLKMAALFVDHPTGRERTAFKAIHWVHPGKIVTFRNGHITKETFAELSPSTLSKEEHKNPAPRLSELLKRSVKKRIRGESDIVCELSGGFDSGSITALTATLLKDSPRELKAISWAPDPSELPIKDGDDERNQIQWMEKRYGFRCHYFQHAKPSDSISSATYRSSFRERATPAIGNARTILSGWGGDEAATFYLKGYHPHLLLKDGFQAALTRLIEDSKRTPFFLGATLRLIRSIKAVSLPRAQIDASPLNNLSKLKPEWQKQLTREYGAELTKDLAPDNTQGCILNLLTRGHLDYRASQDCLDAARTGTSVSFPMLDSELVRLSLSIDAKFFSFDSKRRKLFRRVLKHLSITLPSETKKQEPAFAAQASNCYAKRVPSDPLELKLIRQIEKYLDKDRRIHPSLFKKHQLLGILTLSDGKK